MNYNYRNPYTKRKWIVLCLNIGMVLSQIFFFCVDLFLCKPYLISFVLMYMFMIVLFTFIGIKEFKRYSILERDYLESNYRFIVTTIYRHLQSTKSELNRDQKVDWQKNGF